MSPRETKQERAVRLLTERRLVIEVVGCEERPGLVLARCRGDSGTEHQLGFNPARGRWGCTCPASSEFGRVCAHLIALQLVAVKPHLPALPREGNREAVEGATA